MGKSGLGVIDTFLHNKPYLSGHFPLPDNNTALDVAEVGKTLPEEGRHFVVVGGEFDFHANRLIEKEAVGSGGFYVVRLDTEEGLSLHSQLDIPASKVVVSGNYAYLAAGESGMVVVDISDLSAPRVVSRISEHGAVHDIDINGHMLYLAMGVDGILTVDITQPDSPIVILSLIHI